MRHIFYPSLDACLPIVNIEACIIRFVISQSTGVTQNNSQALQVCVTKNIRRIIYFPLKLIQTCSTPPSVTLRVRSDKPKETLQFFSRSWLTKRANERSVEMLVKELKWYSLFVFFVGVILSLLITSPTYSHWRNSTARITIQNTVWCGAYFCFIDMFCVSSIVRPVACPINCFTF